jgi:hypothetical protein
LGLTVKSELGAEAVRHLSFDEGRLADRAAGGKSQLVFELY